MSMLQMMYSNDIIPSTGGQCKCGVAQGDPLAMRLFCLSIDSALEELGGNYEICAYADDVLLVLKNDQSGDEAVEIAAKIFLKYGLTIN